MNTKTATTPWHLTAAMLRADDRDPGRVRRGSGRLLAAILLIGTAIAPAPAEAQISRAVQRSARTAMRSAERRVETRAVTRPVARKPGCAAISNKCASLPREAAARRVLAGKYPNERIQSETYLRNRNGTRAIDPKTRTGRRVDFVLFSRDGYTRRYEVTSQHADKRAQLAKEQRILTRHSNGRRRTGPAYVHDRETGRLVPVRPEPSKIMRFQ